jgi:hypothetical protein
MHKVRLSINKLKLLVNLLVMHCVYIYIYICFKIDNLPKWKSNHLAIRLLKIENSILGGYQFNQLLQKLIIN